MNDELKIKNNELGGKMNYRYRNDEEMKDSGVEWIGKIPKEWSISRISKEFIIRNEKVSDKDFAPLSVTKQGILPQLDSVAKSDNGDNRKRVCVGDFVINSRADRKGSCGTSSYDGSVSLICNVLTPKYLDSQYIHSLFRNYYFSEEFYRWGSGIVDDLWSTNIEKMKKINIPKPNKNEDKKIAKFLDKKTAQFDSIISKKEALIQKLEEAKKSLISEVVTGKVKVVKTNDGYELVERKKEEMKDSGVEWLGDIPKEWDIKKLKHISILNPSKSEVRKHLEEDIEVSFIPMNSVRLGYINIEQSKKISEIIDGYTYFKNDDIVMAKVTPCFENRNIAISENLVNGIGFGSTELNVIRCIKKEDIEYLYYSLQEEKFINVATSEMTGAGGLKRVPSNFLINAQFAYPNTTKEKEKIIEYLNEKEIVIRDIIDKTKQQIEKLKEAKQSLISEAVTGKIEILE